MKPFWALNPLVFTQALLGITEGCFKILSLKGSYSSLNGQSCPNTIGKGWPSESSFLITGGLGGLGLRVAEWLLSVHPRSVCLASRSGRVSRDGHGSEALLARLQLAHARLVSIVRCDVSQCSEVLGLRRATCGTPRGSVRGVMHMTEVLQDKLLRNMDAAGMRATFAAKAVGAAHLHHSLMRDRVDALTCFSSAAATYGFSEHAGPLMGLQGHSSSLMSIHGHSNGHGFSP